MVGHARCLVNIYAVVVSPSWYNVRYAVTRAWASIQISSDQRFMSSPGWSTMWRSVRWARVSIPGLKYDSRKASCDVKWCETTNDGNR